MDQTDAVKRTFPGLLGPCPNASAGLWRLGVGGSFSLQTPRLSIHGLDTPTSRAGTGLAQVIPGLSTQQGIPETKELWAAVTTPSAPGNEMQGPPAPQPQPCSSGHGPGPSRVGSGSRAVEAQGK